MDPLESGTYVARRVLQKRPGRRREAGSQYWQRGVPIVAVVTVVAVAVDTTTNTIINTVIAAAVS